MIHHALHRGSLAKKWKIYVLIYTELYEYIRSKDKDIANDFVTDMVSLLQCKHGQVFCFVFFVNVFFFFYTAALLKFRGESIEEEDSEDSVSSHIRQKYIKRVLIAIRPHSD